MSVYFAWVLSWKVSGLKYRNAHVEVELIELDRKVIYHFANYEIC